jgi:hypothetical protein
MGHKGAWYLVPLVIKGGGHAGRFHFYEGYEGSDFSSKSDEVFRNY